MEDNVFLSLGLILLFVLIGGVFAATEMAIVTLRESQIDRIESSGPRGVRIATLVRDPNVFLSAVQVGVTVAGFLSSAFGASTVAPHLAPILVSWGIAPTVATSIALVTMTLVIAYASLVLGELAPKRLAMRYPEQFTRVLAPPLRWFAILMRPVIWLLAVSTNGILRLFGVKGDEKAPPMTAEEIRSMIVSNPALPEQERLLLSDVLEADTRRLQEVMRPRMDVDFLDGEMTVDEAYAETLKNPHSRLPVKGESVDDVIGFVHMRDLMLAKQQGESGNKLSTLVRPILSLPGTNRVLPSLALLREEGHQIALVLDELGGTDGIVTLEDLLEQLVGEIYDEYDRELEGEDAAQRARDGISVDGDLILQEVAELTGLELPEGPYETVGGFIVDRLGRFARYGDTVTVEGNWTLRVVGAEQHRIRRVYIHRESEADGGAE